MKSIVKSELNFKPLHFYQQKVNPTIFGVLGNTNIDMFPGNVQLQNEILDLYNSFVDSKALSVLFKMKRFKLEFS